MCNSRAVKTWQKKLSETLPAAICGCPGIAWNASRCVETWLLRMTFGARLVSAGARARSLGEASRAAQRRGPGRRSLWRPRARGEGASETDACERRCPCRGAHVLHDALTWNDAGKWKHSKLNPEVILMCLRRRGERRGLGRGEARGCKGQSTRPGKPPCVSVAVTRRYQAKRQRRIACTISSDTLCVPVPGRGGLQPSRRPGVAHGWMTMRPRGGPRPDGKLARAPPAVQSQPRARTTIARKEPRELVTQPGRCHRCIGDSHQRSASSRRNRFALEVAGSEALRWQSL